MKCFFVSFLLLELCHFLIRRTFAFSVFGNPTLIKCTFSENGHHGKQEDCLHRNGIGERRTSLIMAATLGHGSNQDAIDERDDSRAVVSSIFSQSADVVYSDLIARHANEKSDDVETSSVDSVVEGWLDLESIQEGWMDLKELIDDGDLLPDELDKLFEDAASKSKILDGDDDKPLIDKGGFFVLYQSINALFELDEEEEGQSIDGVGVANDSDMEAQKSESAPSSMKDVLLSYLVEVHSGNQKKFPCGFDCTDQERELIHQMINTLEENESSNLVVSNHGKIDSSQIMGEWDLLYTSSRTMTINKSLSGLGRTSSSKAQFEGLRKSLTGSKYLGKIEYIERFGGEEASFDVSVTGEWMLEDRRNTFTGMPSTSLRVDPEKVMYGPTTNQADEWASLGPIKLLDILYLDEDLMLLRGNANVDALFVYQRSNKC